MSSETSLDADKPQSDVASRRAAPLPAIAALVFVCGWVLMGLEILGGRVLAPFFGSGIHVWGSVISVFLLALSLGYYLGGTLSRRVASPFVLFVIVALSAASIGILPLYKIRLNDWILGWDWEERWGSLAAAIALFLAPSTLLGMVSPYAVRLAATDVSSVGQKAGILYAISTFGSFLGCIVTAFYLIVLMGVTRIIYSMSGALLGTAILFLAAVEYKTMSRLLARRKSE